MHGAAQSLMEAGLTCKQFGKCAVKDELNGKLFDVAVRFGCGLDGTKSLTSEEVLHVIHQFLVIQLLNTGQALCKDLTVASVAAEGEIFLGQKIRLTDCCSFLAERKMCGTRIGGLNIGVSRLGLDLVEHILEFTAYGHVAENADQIFFREVALFQFFFYRFLVNVDRNVLKCDLTF